MAQTPEPAGDDQIRQLRAEIALVAAGFREMRAGFATMASGMGEITRLLQRGSDG